MLTGAFYMGYQQRPMQRLTLKDAIDHPGRWIRKSLHGNRFEDFKAALRSAGDVKIDSRRPTKSQARNTGIKAVRDPQRQRPVNLRGRSGLDLGSAQDAEK